MSSEKSLSAGHKEAQNGKLNPQEASPMRRYILADFDAPATPNALATPEPLLLLALLVLGLGHPPGRGVKAKIGYQ